MMYLTSFVVNISHYIQMSNRYIIHLELIVLCVSYIVIKRETNQKK